MKIPFKCACTRLFVITRFVIARRWAKPERPHTGWRPRPHVRAAGPAAEPAAGTGTRLSGHVGGSPSSVCWRNLDSRASRPWWAKLGFYVNTFSTKTEQLQSCLEKSLMSALWLEKRKENKPGPSFWGSEGKGLLEEQWWQVLKGLLQTMSGTV